jgi:hypothetical protein
MDINSVYIEHRELATPEEVEQWNFNERGARIPTFPNSWRKDMFLEVPDAMGRIEWEKRSPALSLNEEEVQALQKHAANPKLLDVQRRIIFHVLREKMLVQLISCSGAGSVEELCEILRAELMCGVPAPAPDWYLFSSVTFGPRKIGYSACSRRGCLVTESLTGTKFKKCGNCRCAWYCSEQCQASDWEARHKVVCGEASQGRKQVMKMSDFFRKLSDASFTEDLPAKKEFGLDPSELAARMTQNQADLKRKSPKDGSETSSATELTSDSWHAPIVLGSQLQRNLAFDRKIKRKILKKVSRASLCERVSALLRKHFKYIMLATVLVLVIQWFY